MKEFSEFKIINHLTKIREILSGRLPWPVTVEIDPTNACNHQCIWCIDARLHEGEIASLPLDLLFDLLSQLAEVNVQSITIKGGGEPLMYPQIDEFISRAVSLGIQCGLITNGELLDEHLPVIERCCQWVRVSLNAATPEMFNFVSRPTSTDAFERTLAGIQQTSPKVFTGIVTVVSPVNYLEMMDIAVLTKKLGARYIAYKEVITRGDPFTDQEKRTLSRMYQQIKEQVEDHTFQVSGSRVYNFGAASPPRRYDLCKAHHLIAIICADSTVATCCSTRGNKPYSFGSLKEKSFKDLWLSERRQAVLERIDTGACQDICLGRTSYMRYDHYNDLIEYLASSDKPHKNFL